MYVWSHSHPPRRLVLETLIALCGVACLWFAWHADVRWFQRHVLLLSFSVSPLGWWFCHYGRYVGLGLGLLLLLFVRPRAGRSLAASTLGEALGRSAGIVIAVLLSLGVTEGALRLIKQRVESRRRAEGQAGVVSWNRTCILHPRYGYVFAPSQETVQHIGGRDVPFAVDAQHNRASSVTSRLDPRQPTILFAGESITAGSGLHYDETFPSLVGRAFGAQVVNLGVFGYGSDQAYLRLVDTLPRFEQPMAVVTLFLPGMLSRNFLHWRAHLDFDAQGQLTVQPPYERFELVRLFAEKVPFWTDATINRSLALTRAIFIDTAAKARARGAQPLFVIPSSGPKFPREQRPDWWILRDLFEANGLPYLIVDLDEKSEIPGDGHPNPRGARIIADAVIVALRARLSAQPPDRDEQPAFVR